MKLPLWVFNKKTERYEVFPYHLLKTFPDGKMGLDWPVFLNGTASREVKDMVTKYAHMFTHEVGASNKVNRYVLIERQDEDTD